MQAVAKSSLEEKPVISHQVQVSGSAFVTKYSIQSFHSYMASLGNRQYGFFLYAQGFRVNAACTAASPVNNYTSDDVLCIYTSI